MKKLSGMLILLFFIIAFFLHVLALLKIFPIIISTPLLFIAILIPLVLVNDRKKFKGY